jgi:hypothetical protein
MAYILRNLSDDEKKNLKTPGFLSPDAVDFWDIISCIFSAPTVMSWNSRDYWP